MRISMKKTLVHYWQISLWKAKLFLATALALIIVFLCEHHLLAQNTSFHFEGHVIQPGEVKSLILPVVTEKQDSTYIPITIINGLSKGPVLGLIAGIHGYEYPPILAMQKLSGEIDPKDVHGTILIVRLANVDAFFGRSVFYHPKDGKNLNRQFPGSKSGTITEVLAYTISQKIILRCQYVVDIHAGDASEDLHPYIAIYEYGTQTAKAKQMALALDFPWLITSENAPKPGQPTIYCTAEAVSKDIPVVGIEYGKLGQVRPEEADFINKRLRNMMRSLGILSGKPVAVNTPIEIGKRSSIKSEQTGIFYTDYRSGTLFKKGAKLGFVTDLFGNVIQEIWAPFDGFIIYVSFTPPINKGETLLSISVLD